MTRTLRGAIAILALLVLVAPVPVLGTRAPEDPAGSAGPTFDTPEPTPEATRRPRRTPRPDRTRPERTQRPRAERTAAPGESPSPDMTPGAGPRPFTLTPARSAITIGYREPGILGQAPFLVALLAGYFTDAGFEDVRIVEVGDTLTDVRQAQLDFAVVDAREAASMTHEDPPLRAVAGFQNHADDGTYGGDLLLAAPGLVADEPSTVIAFLVAYIRALQDLSDPVTAADSLALIEETDLVVDPELTAGWSEALEVFAPFDGGFGAREDGTGLDADDGLEEASGLEELVVHLEDGDALPLDLSYFIAQHTLNIAQASLGLPPDPASDLLGPPGISDVRVGVPGGIAASPVLAAGEDAGHLAAAGFTRVEVMDVEEPLLGVLTGELEFGIVDGLTLADGASQGLPLVALAGHRNYADDGSYGGDMLVASADLVADEGATVAAFLIAYIRGLQEFGEGADGAPFEPRDGGFGERALAGGTAELGEHLAGFLAEGTGPEDLVASRPLELAQAWWGLPANPIPGPGGTEDPLGEETLPEPDASPDEVPAT